MTAPNPQIARAKFESFEQRLLKARTLRGLTQRQLAKKINKHRSEIHKYEHGAKPAFWTLCELGRALDVSIDYLCGFCDDIRPLKVEP